MKVYEEQEPPTFGLLSLELRRVRSDLLETFKIVEGPGGICPETFLHQIVDPGTRGCGVKLLKHRSCLAARMHLFGY